MTLQHKDSLSSYVQLRDYQAEEMALGLKAQTINDIIYGPITLPRYCWPFINQPAMQRLKNLFQLLDLVINSLFLSFSLGYLSFQLGMFLLQTFVGIFPGLDKG